jgi:hypothetical protein
MLDARRRPVGRLFFGLVSVLLVWWSLAQVPMAVAGPDPAPDPAPATTRVSEGLFGSHSGEQKKESAISFVSAALQLTESVANREIVDELKFKEGLGKIIDGTVECLNASSWSRVDVRP